MEQWDLVVDEPALEAIAAGADALEAIGDRWSAALLRQLVVQAAQSGARLADQELSPALRER